MSKVKIKLSRLIRDAIRRADPSSIYLPDAVVLLAENKEEVEIAGMYMVIPDQEVEFEIDVERGKGLEAAEVRDSYSSTNAKRIDPPTSTSDQP